MARPAALTPEMSDRQAVTVLESLLKNIYRSFDFREEEDIYDRLATSVSGDLLTDIYLQNRKSLVVTQAGGAQARVKEVKIQDVDVSPRTLNGSLSIHLVNTSGPHANAPDGGITEVKPVGPLTVSIDLDHAPKSITMQPEDKLLDVIWANGRATVALPRLELYLILVVEP